MVREFVVLPSFWIKWKDMGLDDKDMQELEKMLLENPKIGDVIRGTGGARKMRFAFENRGKSGSARVIYVDFEIFEKIFFVDTYAKSRKEDLTANERNSVKRAIEIIELSLRDS